MKLKQFIQCVLILMSIYSPQYVLGNEEGQGDAATGISAKGNNLAPVSIVANANLERFLRNIDDVKRYLNVADSIIVDVRSSKEVLTEIPGALRISVFDLKTKKFLRDRNVILLGSGLNDALLVEECAKLSALGFKKLYVLKGGVQALASSDVYKINRKDLSVVDHWVTPREVYALQARNHEFVVINSMRSLELDGIDRVFGNKKVRNIDFINTQKKLLNTMDGFQDLDDDTPVIVVANSNEDYEAIYDVIRKSEIDRHYYLLGGITKYKEYLVARNSMLDKVKRGPVSSLVCEGTE